MSFSPVSSSSKEESLDNITGFTIPDLPPNMTFPPLPPITNQALYKIVTTHSSLCQGPKSSMDLSPTRMVEDYEKLEHVGDALLEGASADTAGAMVAILLHDLFPCLGEGPATTLKASLVSNATLARISDAYHIPDKLQAHPSALRMTRAQVKTRASMFEAWIAGVFYSTLSDQKADREVEQDSYEAGDEAQSEGEEVEVEGEGDVAASAEVGSVADGSAEAQAKDPEDVSSVEAVSTGVSAMEIKPEAPVELESASAQNLTAPPPPPADETGAKEPTTETTTLPTSIEEPEDEAEPSTSTESAPSSELTPSSAVTITSAYQELAILTGHNLKFRWLAMIALDDWLRPLFTPVAHYALDQLRIEHARLLLIPRVKTGKQVLDPAIVAEDLTAVGAAGLLNTVVMQNKMGTVRFEHGEHEKGWRVVCTFTQGDGKTLVGEGIRGNQKTAKALAAHKVCQQLGI